MLLVVAICILLSRGIYGNHFLGGTITWRPLNHSATGSPVAIVITQTYIFNYTAMQCTNAMIMSNSLVPNYIGLASERLECVRNCGSGAVGYTNVSVIPYCTDFSVPGVSIVGQRSDIVYLQSGIDFSASFMAGFWRSLTTVTSGNWAISTRINVTPRPDNGLYNNASVATMMSPINLPVNKTVAIHIPVADADGDTVRCRWANKSNGVDECSSVCPLGSLPPDTIIFPNCTIIITGRNIGDAFAVAVVVEDFVNSTSTTPLSSVPVQFLVEVVKNPSCTTPPEVVGIPPEDSCTPVIAGQTYSSELIAINHCGSGVVIDDIATLSFAGVIQSNITKQNSTTFHKLFTWTPAASQLGYQVMCAMAVDSQDAQSSQYCFSFYVSANGTTDCPGKITLTTYISTTSSTTTTTSRTTSTSSSSSTTGTASSTSSTTTTTGTTSSTSSTTTTTETTSSTSTSTSSTSSSTTTTTDTTSTSSTSSTTSSTTSTSSSSSSTSSSSTSTTSTSTSSTSSTSSTATIATTTVGAKQTPFNWPLFGVLIGLALLAALALCCCFCWCYLWPLVAVGSEYRNDNKPVLYHIEPCADPACRGWDRPSPSDVPLGHYMNLERLRSDTLTSRTLHSSISLSEMTIPTSRTNCFSVISSNTSSHIPSAHVSVSRVSMVERVGMIGNARIQPPTRQIIEEENELPRRRRANTGVIVSRIKSSSHKKTISPDLLSIGRTSDFSRDHVRVSRVHSLPSSIACRTSEVAFSDSTDSKTVTPIPRESGQILRLNYLLSPLTTIKSEPDPKINRRGVTFRTLRSKSSRISAENHIRVERIPSRKRKIRRQHSIPLSLIDTETQKTTINRHSTVHVKRISRTETF